MNKTKILIVEDETIVAFDIECTLESFGYEIVECATTYEEALEAVKNNEIDIILMDINLENSKDGIETTTAIKKLKDIPVIYLTAFTDDKTIQRAVVTEPVGYLIKPFKAEELKSTITLGLYKSQNQKNTQIKDTYKLIGDKYYFDIKEQNLYYDNMPLKLSIKEKALLTLLLEARGNLVTFEDIESNLWPDKPIAQSTLRSLIYRLRCKLEHKYIETIPSFGCRLLF